MKLYLKISLVIFLIGLALIIAGVFIGGNTLLITQEDLISVEYEYKNENIIKLDIDITASEVEIKKSDKFSIEAEEVPSGDFESFVKDDTWYITNKTSRITMFNKYTSKITIYVPNNYVFDNTTINLSAGKVTIEGIDTNNCTLRVGAGELKYKGKIQNNLKVDCGAGNVEVELKGDEEDYNYDVDVGMGQIEINDTSYAGIAIQKNIDNDSNNLIELKVGAGNIKIEIE